MASSRMDHHRIFSPEFLSAMSARRGRRTDLEAYSAGPFRVLRRDDRFAVLSDPEPDDGEPVGEFTEEQHALLLAATLGAHRRPSTLSHAEDRDASGYWPVLDGTFGSSRVVGQMPYRIGDDLSQIHVAEYILRSPHRLASFLEAAGDTVLEDAAKILNRRLDLRDPDLASEVRSGRVAHRYRLEVVADQELELDMRPLKTGDEQAQWLAGVIPRSPFEIGGGLFLDLDYYPIGYSQHDGGFSRMILEPRQLYAPALLLNAGCVSLWHTHPEQVELKPTKRDWDATWKVRIVGRHLGIPLLNSIILGAEDSYVFVKLLD